VRIREHEIIRRYDGAVVIPIVVENTYCFRRHWVRFIYSLEHENWSIEGDPEDIFPYNHDESKEYLLSTEFSAEELKEKVIKNMAYCINSLGADFRKILMAIVDITEKFAQATDAAEKIQDWVKKGYFPDGVNSLTADDNQDRALLYDGSAAMMLHGSWQVAGIRSDNEEWYNENIGVFRFPEDSEAKAAGVPQNVEIGTAIGNGFSFNCFKEDGSVDQDMLDACYVLATQYFNDDTYNKMQMDSGNIPSIKGFDTQVDDPNNKVVVDVFFNASNVQLWYDQYLPASVTEVHKNCMTELFGLEKTPEEIGQEQDEAMQKAIAEQ
jgi:ABC-type glycerol-3-phosphate transport system substrate-binding protein